MSAQLRLTDTNASSDSSGRTWGLEGNLFWVLLGGVGVGVTVLLLLVVFFRVGLGCSVCVSCVPVALALSYIYGLRQGKPPGYDRDWLEYHLKGPGFSPNYLHTQGTPPPWANHP
jgi:hypothetical protein